MLNIYTILISTKEGNIVVYNIYNLVNELINYDTISKLLIELDREP